MKPAVAAAVLGAAAATAVARPAAVNETVLFRDITRDAGITFQHHAAPEKKYIVESMSGGVALVDYDNDGLTDIYFVDSLTVETACDPKAARSALYWNLGNLEFEDVTDKAGVGRPGWAMGVCTADVDGDGWDDLYVTALGGSKLYRNTRDGTFADVTASAGVAGSGWPTGCGFADYDGDGDLDLFVARYVRIDLKALPEFGKDKTCEYRGIAVQCGPRGLPGESDLLFRNDGHGRFTEVGEEAGVSDPREYFGLGLAWFDANDDGWLDLYVANDSMPNFLYINQKDGTFKDAAFPMGVAVSEDGAEQGSMGVAVGDWDGSGRLGLFVDQRQARRGRPRTERDVGEVGPLVSKQVVATSPVGVCVTVAAGTAFRIACSTVVPSVIGPLDPCQLIVHPPHCSPRSSAALPPTARLDTRVARGRAFFLFTSSTSDSRTAWRATARCSGEPTCASRDGTPNGRSKSPIRSFVTRMRRTASSMRASGTCPASTFFFSAAITSR